MAGLPREPRHAVLRPRRRAQGLEIEQEASTPDHRPAVPRLHRRPPANSLAEIPWRDASGQNGSASRGLRAVHRQRETYREG